MILDFSVKISHYQHRTMAYGNILHIHPTQHHHENGSFVKLFKICLYFPLLFKLGLCCIACPVFTCEEIFFNSAVSHLVSLSGPHTSMALCVILPASLVLGKSHTFGRYEFLFSFVWVPECQVPISLPVNSLMPQGLRLP